MNPLGAVEAVSAVRGPSATLQALAEGVVAPPTPAAQTAAVSAGQTAVALPAGTTSTLPGGAALALPGQLPSTVATANALHGRMTLGQLAAEPAALRVASETAAAEAARFGPHAASALDASHSPRPLDSVAVPVLLTPLQTPAGSPAKPRQAAEARRREPVWGLAPLPPEPEGFDDPPAADSDEPAPSADAEAGALRELLQSAGQADALRELALGRRVLVVLPQAGAGHGAVAASAALLTRDGARRFSARWWPGAANAAGAGWLRWRVFRDGDPMLDRGLRSRSGSGNGACRVRLGAQPQRLSDAASASLEITDRIRFVHGLGPQWSLLLVAAPPGAR